MTDSAGTRSLGQVLSAERERQGLARADIAQRLHMSAWQVEALEAGDYARLPRGPFLRGFVRNYARVLHLDPDPLLPLLAEVAPSNKAASIVVPSEKIRFDPMGERLANPYVKAAGMAAVFLSLGFAVMYWWFFIKPAPPAADAAKKSAAQATAPGGPQQVVVAPMAPAEAPPPTEAPREMAPVTNVPTAELPSPRPSPKGEGENRGSPKGEGENRGASKAEGEKRKVEASNAEARRTAVASANQPLPAPSAAAAAAGDKRLAFRFSGESWVEIKDARGRTLMSKLNPAGSAFEVAGRAPFTVIVGNAPDVQMTLDDRPYDLQPHSRVGVARLTVQ